MSIKTIVVDTSAWVALAWQEADATAFRDVIESSRCITSPVILLETHMVMRNRGATDPLVFVKRILAMRTLDVMPLNVEHFAAARDAFDRYGKGRGHPAQLNFGDCMSYALAKVAGVPLLFKGDDFRHTDIKPALSA